MFKCHARKQFIDFTNIESFYLKIENFNYFYMLKTMIFARIIIKGL